MGFMNGMVLFIIGSFLWFGFDSWRNRKLTCPLTKGCSGKLEMIDGWSKYCCPICKRCTRKHRY